MSKVKDEKFTGCAECLNFRKRPWVCRRCDVGEHFEAKDERTVLGGDDMLWGDDFNDE